MRIGHISDLHVFHMEGLPNPLSFLNKRLVGGVNLLLNRSDSHSRAVVEKAVMRLEELDVDHICVTGDLTNLALDSEFQAARDVLLEVPDHLERVSVIPGNHDYYTYEAEREGRFERYFSDFLRSDMPAYQQPSGYPFVHLRDDVAIIGLNSGKATPPLFATGLVRQNELDATAALLADPEIKKRFKVVMIHHPLTPFEHASVQRSRCLVNDAEVLRTIRRGCVDLVIHGHNHHISTQELPHLEGSRTLFICEAGSASVREYQNPRFAGSFNIFDIEDGDLQRIETHLYDGFEDTFVHWHEETYVREMHA